VLLRSRSLIATGAAFDVQYTSGGSPTTINFLANGLPDYQALDAATAAAGFLQPRVMKLYNQNGTSSLDATAAFATAPTIVQGINIGNARALVFDTTVQGGSMAAVFMTLPSGVAAEGNGVSSVSLQQQRCSYDTTQIMQLTNSTHSFHYGYTASASAFLLSYVSTWAITTPPALSPFVSGVVSGPSAIRVWIDENSTTFGFAGDNSVSRRSRALTWSIRATASRKVMGQPSTRLSRNRCLHK
jgi:hypothetical protein